MNDYERVANVIRYLDRHHTDQPALAELARSVGLAPVINEKNKKGPKHIALRLEQYGKFLFSSR